MNYPRNVWISGVLFLLALIFVHAARAIPNPEVLRELYPEHDRNKLFERWVGLSGRSHERGIAADTTHSYDALHLDVEVTPRIPRHVIYAGSFDAVVIMTARAMEEGLGEIEVHLSHCQIDSIRTRKYPQTSEFQVADYVYDYEVITITLPPAIARGDTFEVEMTYANNFGRGSGMSYDRDQNVIWTMGEPYDTRSWLACYDLPFDKVTSKVTVYTVTDSAWKVLSNGALTGSPEDLGNGSTRTVWTNSDPISTYLISVVAADYLVIDDGNYGVNNTPIAYWVYPRDSVKAHYEFGRTGEMLEFFETRFGPYPFNKYDQAMAPMGGAMEHQTATTYGDGLITNSRNRSYEVVVAHELAHQWWGDMVGPLTFAELWLNEGFASYAEVLWREYLYQHEGRKSWIEILEMYYLAEDEYNRFPIYNPPPGWMFSSTVYDKGACILHMLRWVVGDEAFFDGLISYGEAYKYGCATSEDFKARMEAASGMDLTAFFDEWVYQAGYPLYDINGFDLTGNAEVGYTATFTIEQIQENAPYFSTPLPFRFYNSQDAVDFRVEVEPLQSQTVSVEGLNFEPTGFQFDPDNWILCLAWLNGVGVVGDHSLPGEFELSAAWPNPFNASTSVEIELLAPGRVCVDVYDLLGRRVARIADGDWSVGPHRFIWQPLPGTASGIYLISVSAPGGNKVRRVVLLK